MALTRVINPAARSLLEKTPRRRPGRRDDTMELLARRAQPLMPKRRRNDAQLTAHDTDMTPRC